MPLIYAGIILCGLAGLYWFVIRPKGAHILATYYNAGGGWEGVKAVFWGYLTPIAGVLGAVVYALPDLLEVASGVPFTELLPDPWGLYVGTTVAFALPILKAFAATPTGEPPKGEG